MRKINNSSATTLMRIREKKCTYILRGKVRPKQHGHGPQTTRPPKQHGLSRGSRSVSDSPARPTPRRAPRASSSPPLRLSLLRSPASHHLATTTRNPRSSPPFAFPLRPPGPWEPAECSASRRARRTSTISTTTAVRPRDTPPQPPPPARPRGVSAWRYASGRRRRPRTGGRGAGSPGSGTPLPRPRHRRP
jgi:hypothetical protein